MQLPKPTAGSNDLVSYGRYVQSRLTVAGRAALTDEVRKATDALKLADRARDDAAEPWRAALAVRDAIDDAFDDAVRTTRKQLAARSLTAEQETPYTALFPQGVDAYVKATLPEQKTAIAQFVERVEKNLPDGDAVRAAVAPLKTAATDWDKAVDATAVAERALDETRVAYAHARANWMRLLDRTYATLRVDLGKAAAERFFPRPRARSRDDGDDTDTDVVIDPPVG